MLINGGYDPAADVEGAAAARSAGFVEKKHFDVAASLIPAPSWRCALHSLREMEDRVQAELEMPLGYARAVGSGEA